MATKTTMQVLTLTLGDLDTNCYLPFCERTGAAVIIDPGDAGDTITQTILDHKLHPIAILLTHGHFDHVLGCLELKVNFQIPILIQKQDLFLLTRAHSSAEHWLKRSVDPIPPADGTIDCASIIDFGEESLHVIETPGHTPGSVCFVSNALAPSQNHYDQNMYSEYPIIFSGDTLFKYEIGSTNHRYSSKTQILQSLRKLLAMPGETLVLPGHGEQTSIAAEQAFYNV